MEVQYVDIDDVRNRRLVAEYSARSIPLLIIFDRDGQVVATLRGLQREETLRRAIDRALL